MVCRTIGVSQSTVNRYLRPEGGIRSEPAKRGHLRAQNCPWHSRGFLSGAGIRLRRACALRPIAFRRDE